MKRLGTVALMLALASCSTTPEALENSPKASRIEKTYSENYQALYRKIHDPASRCLVGSPGIATQLILDAQLYPDLGFGEMTYSMSSIYGKDYFWKAKVEKAGTGSKLSVVSGNMLGQERSLRKVVGWAEGDTSC